MKSSSRNTRPPCRALSPSGNKPQPPLFGLSHEHQQLLAIFQVLNEAVLLVDAKGSIAFFNRAAQQLLALPENAERMPRLWHWLPTLKSFFTHTNSDTFPEVLATETELTYPEKRFVRLNLQPFSEAGNKTQFIVLLQDVTRERAQSEEQLFQSCLDSVTKLASELAHELGNPLNAIGIHLQLVQRSLQTLLSTPHGAALSRNPTVKTTETSRTCAVSPEILSSASENISKTAFPATLPVRSEKTVDEDKASTTKISSRKTQTLNTAIVPMTPTAVVPVSDKQAFPSHIASSLTTEALRTLQQSLSVCQSEVQRLDMLVQQFLKSVRPQSIQLKRDNVLQPLKKVLSVLKPQLDDAHIAVEVNVSEPFSSVFMDADRLYQAFFNVLKNAREAIGTNGKILISCEQDERYLILSFADSGGGFSDTQAMQLFSSSHATQKQNGHGIGMLIVQRIMREHNGFIEIKSKKTVGSVVTLKFPLPEPMMRKLGTQRSKKNEKGRQKKTQKS